MAAFLFSLIGMSLLAVPMGIWGIVRTQQGRRRGRALAIAALAISAVWVVGSTMLVMSVQRGVDDEALAALDVPTVTTSRPPASAPTGTTTVPTATPSEPALLKPRRVYWERLKPTMCVRDAETASSDLTVVDCRADHQVEVIARTTLPGPDKWPGDTAVEAAAEAKCRSVFASYVGIDYDGSRLDVGYFTTDRAGWEQGDHSLICMVLDPDDEHLTRSLHGARE